MALWLSGIRSRHNDYDGTIGSALRLYQTHKESPFRDLTPGSRKPYVIYLRRLEGHIGTRLIANVTGLDVRSWHRVWSQADQHGRPTKVAAGAMALNVLKAAIKWGALCGIDDCKRFLEDLRLVEVAKPKPRSQTAIAADVVKARLAAHANRAPSRALAYAIQFETALRQCDVIGQWYDLDYPVISAVVSGNQKWVGLEWKDIGSDLVLRYKPSKTVSSSEATVVLDLTLCPMVLEEIARTPEEMRVGPMIINERSGLPYRAPHFEYGWRKDFAAAGLPRKLWARDLRASAVTEGRRAGATIADAAKVAGHTKEQTTAEVYDRAKLEAARRFQTARLHARDR